MGSAATFNPTCFMAAMERTPPMDAPMAASMATFSLGAHSAVISRYVPTFSKISVLGVPGYAEAKATPASYAPRATASLPVISCRAIQDSTFQTAFACVW